MFRGIGAAMFSLKKNEPEGFVWSRDVAAAPARSVWARLTGKKKNHDDDDDDMPGPNAGASLWPPRMHGPAVA